MPSSTRSNKETQLLFSLDPASLERSIRKEARSSSIDNNTCSSLDSRQPLSTQALVPSTDTRSPPSTEDTHFPSTDIFHSTSIDTSEGHLHNAAGQRIDAQGAAIPESDTDVAKQEELLEGDFEVESSMSFGGSHWCRSMPYFEHRTMNDNPNRSTGSPEYRSITPTESTTSCNAVMILTHVEFAARHPHPPSPVYVKIDRHSDIPIDRHYETDIDRQPPAPIDRRAPLTYRVQMPKIDIARLNALRTKPKPSENPPETARIPLR
ncbi:hypothetical protein F2Q70_00017584 [Brassica cretica]|uniref:Uncharacterized protein n=1 Tax=Brassica cretica TaxID=69181 RepID=A0A8S9HVQ7_BRACR|nr:hypothetical protein F2Q70_00017584 [Brassica cretica]